MPLRMPGAAGALPSAAPKFNIPTDVATLPSVNVPVPAAMTRVPLDASVSLPSPPAALPTLADNTARFAAADTRRFPVAFRPTINARARAWLPAIWFRAAVSTMASTVDEGIPLLQLAPAYQSAFDAPVQLVCAIRGKGIATGAARP